MYDITKKDDRNLKKFLTEKETRERVTVIGSNAQEINLSADKDFNQLYMDAMYFEKG